MALIKKFNPDLSDLSSKERLLVDKLILAGELIVPLYLKHKNDKYLGANFYPPDATKEEIEQAAKKNPAILDPYTSVERDKTGKLIAIPYHLKFKEELKKVSQVLIEAAKLSDDKNFSNYLKTLASSLLNGNYRKGEKAWLKTVSSKFGFVIGPIEAYLDKLFHKKTAYKSIIGVLNERKTKEAQKIKETILVSSKKTLLPAKRVNAFQLNVRVEKTILFSGLTAEFGPTGGTLPNDFFLIEKYGSILTIFEDSLKERFKKDHLPIFKTIFDKNFQERYSEKELYEASFRCILVHEIGHNLIYYQGAQERLQNLYPFLNELYAYILGIERCQTLCLKNIFSSEELEMILIMHICRNFTWWFDFLKLSEASSHAIGSILMQNFFLKEKAIEIDKKKGILKIDFSRAYFCINECCRFLEYYLSLGSYKEVQEFINAYGQPKIFQRDFSSILKKISRKINYKK